MKLYDCEHHGCSKAMTACLRANAKADRFPKLDEEDTVCYNEGFLLPMSAKSYNNPSDTKLDDITDFGDKRIANMDRAGVSCAFISTFDGLELFPREDCIRIARETNNEIAEAVKKYPGRFFGAFCLPTPYLDAALEELDRAVNELGLTYWHTISSYAGGKHLYDEEFEPLFAKLAAYDIPFYVHPTSPSSEFFLDSGPAFSGPGFGFGCDVMKTTMRIMMRGVFDRYPNLRMITGHMAEFYPYIIERMDNRFAYFGPADPYNKSAKRFKDYFIDGNIFMTTSGIFDSQVIRFVIEKFGSDCILFGSDYPFEDFKASREFIENLPVSDEDKEKISYRNAEKYILKLD